MTGDSPRLARSVFVDVISAPVLCISLYLTIIHVFISNTQSSSSSWSLLFSHFQFGDRLSSLLPRQEQQLQQVATIVTFIRCTGSLPCRAYPIASNSCAIEVGRVCWSVSQSKPQDVDSAARWRARRADGILAVTIGNRITLLLINCSGSNSSGSSS